MKKIVILDGYTINPGDLSWSALEALGQPVIFDQTPDHQVDERISDASIVLSSKILFDQKRMARHPQLEYIGSLSTGYNLFDLDAARAQGITITNIPEYATMATAQMTLALILELTNHVGEHDQRVHEGDWLKTPHFCFWTKPLMELSGKTIGLFGYGRIARKVAHLCHALGMHVLATSRSRNSNEVYNDPDGFTLTFVDKDTLFSGSDFLSFHCPLTEETHHMVNAESIRQMKTGVYLINTSRGQVFDERAVSEALKSNKIAGVAVDVLSSEPPSAKNPLLHAPRCIITPHIAWAPMETRKRLIDTAVSNLSEYLSGNPKNVVS